MYKKILFNYKVIQIDILLIFVCTLIMREDEMLLMLITVIQHSYVNK